jgi:hypothetical protein
VFVINQLTPHRDTVMTNINAMSEDKPKPKLRRPDVLRKFNAESLQILERGLVELPKKLRSQALVPVRGNSTALVVREPSFLSACLPVIPHSPVIETPTSIPNSDDESPLKKTFSFRDKLSRMSIFGKDKDKEKMEKPKWKTITEEERSHDKKMHHGCRYKPDHKAEQDHKSSKRFWFFRHKEIEQKEKKRHSALYIRSKSFEFLPKAIEEQEEEIKAEKNRTLKHSHSYCTSTESLDTISNDSFEFLSNANDDEDCVFLKSGKGFASGSSTNDSSASLVTSASSGIVMNMFKSESVQDILNDFNKAVELFSESYLSDSEPYTRCSEKVLSVMEKRKSSSFTTLPSPKIMQVNKVNRISEDFKKELNKALIVKRACALSGRPRRASVTDCFLLEDKTACPNPAAEQNKYRRAQKKPINRVRRISSTKYVSNLLLYYAGLNCMVVMYLYHSQNITQCSQNYWCMLGEVEYNL